MTKVYVMYPTVFALLIHRWEFRRGRRFVA